MTTSRLSEILSLGLEVTTHCNLLCPQCSRVSIDGKFDDSYLKLQHWQVEKILPNFEREKLENLKRVRIEGDNGDAFMHPKIDEIIDYFYRAPSQPTILMLTNGSLRSKNWWENLGKKFPNRLVVQFSIDGLKDTNSIYRINSNYDKIISNAKAYINGGGIATTRSIIFKHNEHQVEQIYKTAREIGFKQLSLIVNDQARFYTGEYYEVYKNNNKLYNLYPTTLTQKDLDPYCYKDHNLPIGNPKLNNPKFLCPIVASGEITVTYQGHIIPCCMVNVDYDIKSPNHNVWRNIVGNREHCDLHIRPIGDILNDPEFYHNRLEKTLQDGNFYYRCEQYCKNEIDQKKLQN